jgi:hypothetical protein
MYYGIVHVWYLVPRVLAPLVHVRRGYLLGLNSILTHLPGTSTSTYGRVLEHVKTYQIFGISPFSFALARRHQADLFEDFFLDEDFSTHLSFLFLPHLRVRGNRNDTWVLPS